MPRNIYLYHNQKWCPAGYLNVTCLLKIKDNAKKNQKKKQRGFLGLKKCAFYTVYNEEKK